MVVAEEDVAVAEAEAEVAKKEVKAQSLGSDLEVCGFLA